MIKTAGICTFFVVHPTMPMVTIISRHMPQSKVTVSYREYRNYRLFRSDLRWKPLSSGSDTFSRTCPVPVLFFFSSLVLPFRFPFTRLFIKVMNSLPEEPYANVAFPQSGSWLNHMPHIVKSMAFIQWNIHKLSHQWCISRKMYQRIIWHSSGH